MRRVLIVTLLSAACLLALAGCYGRAVRAPKRTASPEELATLQVSPSAPTPLSLVAATTPFPTDTPTPAPTDTPTPIEPPRARVHFNMVNVRLGPGTSYAVAGQLTMGVVVDVFTRTLESPAWYEICCIAGKHGWMREDTLELLMPGGTGEPTAMTPSSTPPATADEP